MIQERLKRKKLRIRSKISGTATRPRLTVYKSLTRIYAQLIDDDVSKTVVTAMVEKKNVEAAKELGKKVGELAKAANIEKAVFDRNGNLYHGVIKAVAESARDAGLVI
jgi:large subunit ribosomal protein L18